jgi:hypothetical protein
LPLDQIALISIASIKDQKKAGRSQARNGLDGLYRYPLLSALKESAVKEEKVTEKNGARVNRKYQSRSVEELTTGSGSLV